MTRDDLHNRFDYHKPKDATVAARHEKVRTLCRDLAENLMDLTPPTREQSLAITKLEEVMFWANAAIARNQ